MNYEKKLALAKEALKSGSYDKKTIEYIFPELKESEDERIIKWIRKELESKYVVENIATNIYADKALAWLEKQKTSEKALQYLKDNHSPSEVSDFQAAMNIAVAKAYEKGYNDALEKQGEQKFIWHNEDEEPKRGSLILLIMQSGTPIVAKIIEPNHTFNHGERWAYIDDLLEKQVEQNPTDKVEPRFKGGDWISNGRYAKLIVGINSDWPHYMFYDGTSERIKDIDKKYHLWTIQDAKPGDVLAAHECIVLFREIDGLNIKCHCAYYFMNNPSFYVDTLQNKSAFHPATKEQRDLLFSKMKEAGYMWDANKKELKKIEPKPAIEMKTPEKSLGIDSETYNKIVDECVYGEQKPIIEDKPLVIDDGKSEIDYCFTKMMNGEKVSSAWSEEDELHLKDAIHAAYSPDCGGDELIEWLKSLKDRFQPQWKPSDEQMKALAEALSLAKNCGEESAFDLRTLYEQLKKLKGE